MKRKRLTEKHFWCLERLDFAEVLSRDEHRALLERMHFSEHRAGEVIYFAGDPSASVYLVYRGEVQLKSMDEDGNQLTLALLKPGNLFGLMALAGEEARNWTAEAASDATLCALHRDDLLRLERANAELAIRVSTLVGERVVAIENKLRDLLFKGVHERLAGTLVRLAHQCGQPSGAARGVRLEITHQELADLIGATRESVSPALGDLEDEGLIEKRYGSIIIEDVERLKAQG